jgi:Ig-like domain from next to BRCA1 gene
MRCTAKWLYTAVAVGVATLALVWPVRSPADDDDAAFASQSVPESMSVGSRVFVTLTFRNTGATSWTAQGGYLLGPPDPATGATWQVSSVALPSAVPAGSSVTFSFRVTAPATPGTYNFQWQMQSRSRFFGATSTNVPIKVVG